MVDFYDAFFSEDMPENEYDAMTYQISDHLPLWAEFEIKEWDLDQFIRQ